MASRWNAAQVLDAYFLEVRAKLLEIAATLDRIDRAPEARSVRDDPRLAFIRSALHTLESDRPDRAETLQRLYSKD